MKPISYALPLAFLCLPACTWVPLSEEAEEVILVEAHHVTGCSKLASTNASVKNTVGPISRSEETVLEELTTLARNKAAELGGNTIVARGAAIEGKMSFDIYKCGE